MRVKSGCEHHWCKICVERLFVDSMMNERLFPPKCCGNRFRLKTALLVLGIIRLGPYISKAREHDTVNKLYCPNPRCSTFLGNKSEAPHCCSTCFCGICKNCSSQSHAGPCTDSNTAVFTNLATREGWRQCNACHRFVELAGGCYHIVSLLSLSLS